MAQMIRVGMIGFGVSAQVFHAPFLVTVPGYSLDCIVQRHGDSALKIYPGVKVAKNAEELFADPHIDLVVITTPNDTHYEFAQKALQAQKHVVVEKPFTITSAQAASLIEISREAGKVLSVYQNRRYTGDFRTIQQILTSGCLGPIVEFEALYDRYRLQLRPGAWREKDHPGSGILYDLGSHLIDQALYLFGSPDQVTASLRIQRPGATANDYFDLRLDYPGTAVRLKSGMLVRELGPRYQLHGFLGSFVKYGEDPQEAELKSGKIPQGPQWGLEPAGQWGILHTAKGDQVIRERYPTLAGNFGDYYRELHNAISTGTPPPVSAVDGYKTIRLIELALESHRLGKTINCEPAI
jgi:scyllo-inositol 2-dehydrogenase (NADP+)